jgi:DNA polymerase-3 subunit beta
LVGNWTRTVLPIVHTPYDYNEIFLSFDMTTETIVSEVVKFSCSRDDLSHALAVVGRAVSTRVSVQILSGIALRGDGGRLELAATDMELSLRTSLAVDIDEEGAVVVPGRLLLDIVRLLPPGEVSVEYRSEEGVALLTCGSSSYRLNTYAPADFPRLPAVEADRLLDLDRDAFLETVARVSRAASRDESRPVLTGILVRLEGQTLSMAATDSYRLSVKETELPANPGRDLEAIIPARALGELARIAQGSSNETLQLDVQENQVVFGVDGAWLTARRIDGQFPNYRQLRPESFEVEMMLPREELLDAVRRVGVLAQRNSPLRLRFEEGQLTIQAQTQDVGEAQETVPIAYGGDVLEIGFNPDFLRDGLESVSETEVKLQLISPLRPGLISGAGTDFWYLIMPIRLAG